MIETDRAALRELHRDSKSLVAAAEVILDRAREIIANGQARVESTRTWLQLQSFDVDDTKRDRVP